MTVQPTRATPINRARAALSTVAPAPSAGRAPAASGRMSLDNVTEGGNEPYRIIIYGVEGIGKTSFALSAPKPIVLGAENGLGAFPRQKRFPKPGNWADCIAAVDELIQRESAYRSLVVDTLDWAEPLAWADVCAEGSKKSIKDFKYGDGFTAALEKVREFCGRLEVLQEKRGMNIILVAHAHLRSTKSPDTEDYERWTMKLHEKSGAAYREWAEDVLFTNYELYTAPDESGRHKAISTGKRLLFTEKRAAFDAKNRWSLPEVLDLDWHAYAKAVTRNRRAAEEIRELLNGQPDRLVAFERWVDETDPKIHEFVAKRDALIAEGTSAQPNSNDSNEGATT